MFTISKQALGKRGAFVKLVQLDSEDYAVVVRPPLDGRLQHRYVGPDLPTAEEVFDSEAAKLKKEAVESI
jgi:hypothetical protein